MKRGGGMRRNFVQNTEILEQVIWRKDTENEPLVEILTPPLCTLTVRDRLGVLAVRQFLGNPEIIVNNEDTPPN